MKRISSVIVILFLLSLSGCNSANGDINRVMTLREKLLQGRGCSFEAEVVADYGDLVYTFSMSCISNELGNVEFVVREPETLSGISGVISNEGGKLTFDEQVLGFPLLADGQITPVSAPWLMIYALRGGYLAACGTDGDLLRISIDDSYNQDSLRLDVWVNNDNLPVRGEILWQGRRIVSLSVNNFLFL